jgi:pyruvate dehydrogenase phosphatase
MPQSDPPPDSVDDTIKFTFKEFDDLIVHDAAEQALSMGSKVASVKLLAPALAGSCALVAFYDHYSRLLRVALTGDSRAVLGRRHQDESGKDTYTVHVLSRDQNASNPDEEARLNALHPGEKIMENGRVLGWGMSRAFGDAKYKWSRETQSQLRNNHLGGSVPSNVKTPPYFTAEPVITTTEVKPGDFMVLYYPLTKSCH